MDKNKGAFRTSIGGQALIEGILMRGPKKDAIVVRSPEGLVTKVTDRKLTKANYPILGVPIIRGAVTFIGSMITGVKALMFSADYFPEDENAKPDRVEEWLEKHVPAEKLQNLLVAFSVILSIGMMLVLFMLLPTFLAGLFHAKSAAVHNVIEGVVKVLVLLGYMILCSKQKDVHRVFCYHGAEHKTIFCYEAGLPLTVENVPATIPAAAPAFCSWWSSCPSSCPAWCSPTSTGRACGCVWASSCCCSSPWWASPTSSTASWELTTTP